MDAKRSAKWKKFIAEVMKKGVVACMERRTQPDLEKLLCAAASKRGCELSRQDAARLINYAGNDWKRCTTKWKRCVPMWRAEPSHGKRLTDLPPGIWRQPFSCWGRPLLREITTRHIRYWNLLFYQNEEPVNVLAVLSSVYLDLYRVRAAVQSGFSAQEPAKYFDYKKKEFRLRNAERDVRPLSPFHAPGQPKCTAGNRCIAEKRAGEQKNHDGRDDRTPTSSLPKRRR